MRDKVDAAIGRGLKYLGARQKDDGSFTSWSSARMQPFKRLRSWRTVFLPALMLGSLAGLDDESAVVIRKRLADFLLRERGDNWSFNYWAGSAPEHRTQPYPDDLDDTFCALAGLYLHDPDLIGADVLAKAVKLLLATEVSVGGPYRTWLVAPDSEPVWLDVDMAVNSNIAYFLSLVSDGVPGLDRMMGEAIKTGSFKSPYYPSEYAFIYYFARAYRGPHKKSLLDKAHHMHRSAKTDLDRALAMSARLRLDDKHGLDTAVHKLMAGQKKDGSWAAATFYADPVKDGEPYYNGGPELTTAFVLETLSLYRKAASTDPGSRAGGGKGRHGARIMERAGNQCRGLDEDLRRVTLKELDKLAAGSNGAEIMELARRFNLSLVKPLEDDGGLMDELGLANLWGWLAYTIYDDFLDEEARPGLLPPANAALRRSLDGFLGVAPENEAFAGLVQRTFDAIDGANAWEQAHCRFKVAGGAITIGALPDYGDMSKLAGRSLGHTLPPMAVLAAAGHDVDGPSARQTLEAIKHYLIVRQLNDDAHDWPEDMAAGHITPVVSAVLSDLKMDSGSRKTIKVAGVMPDARRRFWHDTLPEICRLMKEHIASGRRALSRSGLVKEGGVMQELFDGLETSVEDTLAQQSQAETFLRHYARTPEGAKHEDHNRLRAGAR